MREIIWTAPLVPLAPFLMEGVVLGGAMIASLYLGLCIGSLMVALGQTVTTSTLVAFMTYPLQMPPTLRMEPVFQTVLDGRR
jgi:hypothetical protein